MMRHTAFIARASVAILSFAAGLSACSSQDSGATDSGATNPGDSVLVKDAQHVVWTNSGGGFVVLPPPGAACSVSARYDFGLNAGSLDWNVCTGNDPANPTSYSMVMGSRVLTADERTQATAAARAVTISDRMTCGADKPNLTLEIVVASGSTVYGDDFYACQMVYGHYVLSSTLDQLGSVLGGMAHSP